MARPRTHTDAQLVAAAARAVGRHGPQELTLAQVAAEAGVAPTTLVQRFGSKRTLLLAVAGAGRDVVGGRFAAARARHRSPLRALEAALADCARAVTDPDEVAHHLAFLALDLADPEFRELAARHMAALQDEVERLLQEAAGHDELRRRGRRALAASIVEGYNGAMLLWAIDRRGDVAARVRDHVRRLLAYPR